MGVVGDVTFIDKMQGHFVIINCFGNGPLCDMFEDP